MWLSTKCSWTNVSLSQSQSLQSPRVFPSPRIYTIPQWRESFCHVSSYALLWASPQLGEPCHALWWASPYLGSSPTIERTASMLFGIRQCLSGVCEDSWYQSHQISFVLVDSAAFLFSFVCKVEQTVEQLFFLDSYNSVTWMYEYKKIL